MPDRPARDRAALALRRLAANRITNEEFVDMYPAPSQDAAVRAIGDRAWSLYDDFREHRLDATPELRREIARWVVFLHTDLAYDWPRFAFIRMRAPRWLDRLAGGRLSRRQDEALARFAATGEYAVWPFRSGADLASAAARPRYLVGTSTDSSSSRRARCS